MLAPIVRNIFKKNENNIKMFQLMIIGGSQGAKIFNRYFHQTIFELSKKIKLKIIHQTNKDNINFLKRFYNQYNIQNKVFSFENNFLKIKNW